MLSEDSSGIGATVERLPRSRTHAEIVRIGDTVRRPTGPWTPTVHAYLNHLAEAAFSGSPRVLGVDESGREILSYLEGDVPYDPDWEPGEASKAAVVYRSLDALEALGLLLRSLHEAAAGFKPRDPIWRTTTAVVQDGEIPCHGDIGPWNTVYTDGIPTAFIDWDSAKPDRPLLELAQAVWQFVPLGPDPTDRNRGFPARTELGERVERLCRAYGESRRSVIAWALRELKHQHRESSVDEAGQPSGLHGLYADHLAWLDAHEDDVLAKLDGLA